ncbi:AAA-ATPase [Microbacterium phage Cece]|nr:AAA-ATPase [Microbacterium phage Cece]
MTGHSSILQPLDRGAEWSHVTGALGLLCNRWAGRRDLTVQMGLDEAGKSTAFFIPSENRIQINAADAFGAETKPSNIGILTEPGELAKYPVAGGLALHEASHARWTQSDWNEVRKRVDSDAEWNVFVLLEETRIEGRASETHGWDRGLLRSSARALVMADRESWAKSPRTAAQLLLGREAVGVLDPDDVAPVKTWLLDHGWSESVLTQLAEVTSEFLMLDDPDDIDTMLALAHELHEAMPADPSPSGDEGDGDGESLSDSLADAVSSAVSRAVRGGTREVQESADAMEAEEARAQREREAKVQERSERVAEDVFGGNGDIYLVPSELKGTRPPNAAERLAAAQLAKALESAKYRDHIELEYQSEVPPGRLDGGEAMRRAAAISVNAPADRYDPFLDIELQEVDEPPLTVGIMCDVSGSMTSLQPTVGSAVWVISEAVSRIDRATAAQVYFGDKAYPGLAKGERLSRVRTWTGGGGMEAFNQGFLALNGELTLLHGTGARLLFVISDGQFKRSENDARDKWIKACVNGGVGVVWLSYDGKPEVERIPGLEIVKIGTDLPAATTVIGSACVRALARASGI